MTSKLSLSQARPSYCGLANNLSTWRTCHMASANVRITRQSEGIYLNSRVFKLKWNLSGFMSFQTKEELCLQGKAFKECLLQTNSGTACLSLYLFCAQIFIIDRKKASTKVNTK